MTCAMSSSTVSRSPAPQAECAPRYVAHAALHSDPARRNASAAWAQKIGDPAFFQLLKDWATQNRYGNVTTPQFIALAEQKSGMDLTAFFDAWIFEEAKPTIW